MEGGSGECPSAIPSRRAGRTRTWPGESVCVRTIRHYITVDRGVGIPRHHHIRPPVGVPNGPQGREHFLFRKASHRVHSTVLGSGYAIRRLKLVLRRIVWEGNGGLRGQVWIRSIRNVVEPALRHRRTLGGPGTTTEVLSRSTGGLWLSLVRGRVLANGLLARRKGGFGQLVLVRVLVMFHEQPSEEFGM